MGVQVDGRFKCWTIDWVGDDKIVRPCVEQLNATELKQRPCRLMIVSLMMRTHTHAVDHVTYIRAPPSNSKPLLTSQLTHISLVSTAFYIINIDVSELFRRCLSGLARPSNSITFRLLTCLYIVTLYETSSNNSFAGRI